MPIKLVYNNIDNKLTIPQEFIPKGRDKPLDHHFLSTDADNLIELAGRTCYDSTHQKGSRNSEDYHKHINEVNHGSTQEHLNMVFNVYAGNVSKENTLISCLNRPGVYAYCELDEDSVRITTNVRALNEWGKFKTSNNLDIGPHLFHAAKATSPLALSYKDYHERKVFDLVVDIVPPITENEIWVSSYIYNVSRGLSHELVRHGDFTAISQRSTRFCDEHESDWIYHPLLLQYVDHINQTETLEKHLWVENEAKKQYEFFVNKIQDFMSYKGVDKLTARKQARGAARGLLGNALATELIFSANLAQWKRMILQRANKHADAEIRLLFNEAFDLLQERFPEHFSKSKWCKIPCPDGIGFDISLISETLP